MKRPQKEYNENKHLRAYLVVITERLAALEAKLDLIQHSLSGDGETSGLKFLDPKRKRIEDLLTKKYRGDIATDLGVLLSLIDAGEKVSSPRA